MIKETEEIKKVAIYTRVAIEDQARVDSQLERLRAYCEVRDWQISKEYVDAGFSGRNTKRPQYQQMFKDMDKWDVLLVLKLDRIHRKQKNFIAMLADLSKARKQFVSITEPFDTSTTECRFIVNILQGLAQPEIEKYARGQSIFVRIKCWDNVPDERKLDFFQDLQTVLDKYELIGVFQ